MTSRPLFHHHYVSESAGHQALRQSLLVGLVGVPVAAVVWRLWSLVFVGPSAAVQPQRFDGWARVVVQLPGTLLVLGAAVSAVVLAARAAAARAEHADEAQALAHLVLLVVLLVLGTTVLDTVREAPTDVTTWVVRAAVLAVTATSGVAAYIWSRDARR